MIQQSLSRNRYSRVTSRRANILSSACNGHELPARAPSNKQPLEVNPTGDNQPGVRRRSPVRRTANIRSCQGKTPLQSTLWVFAHYLVEAPNFGFLCMAVQRLQVATTQGVGTNPPCCLTTKFFVIQVGVDWRLAPGHRHHSALARIHVEGSRIAVV